MITWTQSRIILRQFVHIKTSPNASGTKKMWEVFCRNRNEDHVRLQLLQKILLCWDVHMVSSYCGKELQDTVKWLDRKHKKYIDIDRLQTIKQYNHSKRGGNTADKMIAYSPHSLKNETSDMRIIFLYWYSNPQLLRQLSI